MDMLKAEIEDLQLDDFDIDLLGFDEKFLDGLLEPEPTAGLTDEDAVPEVPETPKTVLGDVWVLGDHRLMCGDSTSIDAVEKLMDGQQANMLHTDPPYGVDYEGVPNDHLKDAQLEKFLVDALTSAHAVLHPGSNVYVWHADITAFEFISAFRLSGFKQARPSTIQWVKPSLTMSQGDYHSQNEPCLFGWKEGSGRVRVKDRKQTTIWHCDRTKEAKVHPTMKPVELCQRAIENSSVANCIVLDLFGGSGSTLIACEKTNRHARLMELDAKYCDVIIKRWQEFTGKEAVHAETGETFNASR
jgi:DNA modification methylase